MSVQLVVHEIPKVSDIANNSTLYRNFISQMDTNSWPFFVIEKQQRIINNMLAPYNA
jgi:hypothetical protein